ncbi:unnamed protein product [Closterium sp. NIES-53]
MDAWCAGLRAPFEPIASSISARQKLRTLQQLGSVQYYTSGFLALCEQVDYMHEAQRVDRYVGGMKPEISQEIILHRILIFNEVLALAEKVDILRRLRPGSYYGHRSRGPTEHAIVYAVATNAAAAPFKGALLRGQQVGPSQERVPRGAKAPWSRAGEGVLKAGKRQQSVEYWPTTDETHCSLDFTEPHRVTVPIHAIDRAWLNKEGTLTDCPILIYEKIQGVAVKIFIGAGASHSLVNTTIARKLHMTLSRCLLEIDARLVDGMPLVIQEKVERVKVRSGGNLGFTQQMLDT